MANTTILYYITRVHGGYELLWFINITEGAPPCVTPGKGTIVYKEGKNSCQRVSMRVCHLVIVTQDARESAFVVEATSISFRPQTKEVS